MMKYKLHNNDLIKYADNCLAEGLWTIKSIPKDKELELTKQVLNEHTNEYEVIELEGTKQLWEEIIDKMKSQICESFDTFSSDRWYATYYDGLNLVMVALVPDSDISKYPNLYRYEWNIGIGGLLEGDDTVSEPSNLRLEISCHKLTRNDKYDLYRPHKYEWYKSSLLIKIRSLIERIRYR